MLQEPRYTWDLHKLEIVVRHCGPEGWFVITHGVGAMRRYCIEHHLT
jgi:hypothetical protein